MSVTFKLPENFTEIEEPKPLAPGMYYLNIVDATAKESKNGAAMIVLRLDFEEHPDAPTIFHHLVAPTQKNIKDGHGNMMWLNIKKFLSVFEINDPQDGILLPEDFSGQSANIYVGVEPDQNGTPRNVLQINKVKIN